MLALIDKKENKYIEKELIEFDSCCVEKYEILQEGTTQTNMFVPQRITKYMIIAKNKNDKYILKDNMDKEKCNKTFDYIINFYKNNPNEILQIK